jgi:cell division protein FtsW
MEQANSRSQPFLIEPFLMAIVSLMVLFSVVMVYSTTGVSTPGSGGDPGYYVKRQLLALILGIVCGTVAYYLPLGVLRRWSPMGYPLAIFCLLMVLIPGLGVASGGAQRWLYLGPLRFQPGELVKVLFVFYLAGYFERHEADLGKFINGVVKPMLLVVPVGFLFLMQPDFGSFAVILCLSFSMAMVAGVRVAHFMICGITALLAITPIILISPYRMRRLLAFISPFDDATGSGYQLVQSLIALGSGEFLGQGLGRGQQKLHYLPAAHTDFIFAVIGEELGFVGCVAVLIAFSIILWRSLKLAHRFADDVFLCTLVVGLALFLVLPAFLNVAVVTGLLPTKGMVLPLIGYGGSSMMVSLTGVGLLLNLFKVAQLRSLGEY